MKELDLTEVSIKHKPFKRGFDILFSLAILILFSPLLLLIAFCIRFTSPGPLVYAHERMGRGGKKFRCYKFRTMFQDADSRLKELLANCEKKRHEWETTWKLKDDPRVTPIGHFLRKTSLDEIPQFLNVLKGDLSVVGPRPVVQAELETHYGQKALKVLSIRPGLTGLWQVSGRNDTSYATRISLDEHYIDHQNLLLDVKLILKTIPAMLLSKGAY